MDVVVLVLFVRVGVPRLDRLRGGTYRAALAVLGFVLLVSSFVLLEFEQQLIAALAAVLAIGLIARLAEAPTDRLAHWFADDAHSLLDGAPHDRIAATALLARTALVARRLTNSVVRSIESRVDIREVTATTIRYDLEERVVMAPTYTGDVAGRFEFRPQIFDLTPQQADQWMATPVSSDESDWIIRFWPNVSQEEWKRLRKELSVSVSVVASVDQRHRHVVQLRDETPKSEELLRTFRGTVSFAGLYDTVIYTISGLTQDARNCALHFMAWHVVTDSWIVESRVANAIRKGVRAVAITEPAMSSTVRRPDPRNVRITITARDGAAIIPSDAVVLLLVEDPQLT